MKIIVFKNPENQITREYDLTNCSIGELEEALLAHCEACEVVPTVAAVIIPAETYTKSDYIVKGTSTNMSMQEVAVEILRFNHRNTQRSKA